MFFLKLLIAGALLTSCGGGNGASTSAQVAGPTPQVIVNKTMSLAGVVVDGYMQGATVFVDRNNNGVHDGTEPFSVTDKQGGFQLTGLKLGDEHYPIVADVPATAMDSDTGRAVGHHSIMNAPAPGIVTQTVVISPITTLITTVMNSTPNSDKYTAAQRVKKTLALSANSNVDLFANYMTLETNSADYAKVHRVAQVVARTVARQVDAVHQSAVKSHANATFSDAIALITTQVVNQLPTIEKAIPVGTPSVVGLAWDAYTHSIAVADRYTSPINLADTYTFNPAVNHQIQLTAAATQKAQAVVAKTSIQTALVLQDAYVQVVAQDAYSLALAMLKSPKITQAQVSVTNQSLIVANANQSTVIVASSPVIALKGIAIQTVAQGSVFTDSGSTVTDNVDTGLIATVTGKVNTAFLGSYILTYTAQDKAGNTAIAVKRTVKVTDQTAPVVTAPVSITVASVNATGTPSSHTNISSFLLAATAKDNVDATSTVTQNAPTQFPLGVTTVTFTSIDKAGNTGTSTATVNVADQTAPIVTTPTSITVAAVDAKGTNTSNKTIAAFLAGARATDNVDFSTIVIHNAPSLFPLGVTTVTFTSIDKAGNKGVATATVSVTDQTVPVIALIGANPITVAQGSVFTDAGSTVTDNVDQGLIATVTGKVNTALLGSYILTYAAQDKSGNAATAVTRTVKVTDQTAPIVTAPTSITVAAVNATGTPSSHTKISSFLLAATAKDNVDATSTVTQNAPTQFPLGVTTVTFTSIDKAGNKGIATATVNIADQTAPVITLKGANPLTLAQGSTFTDSGSTVTDNVDTGLIATVTSKVNTALLGSYTLTYTAKDKAGNAAVAVTRTVNVTDQTSPVITLKGANPITVAQGSVFTDAGSTVTDNVDQGLIATVTSTVNTSIAGTYTLTYTVKDKAGNAALWKVRTVTVSQDNIPPVLTLTGKSPVFVAVGSIYKDAGATALDNIDGSITAKIVVSNLVNSNALGAYTVTYNVKDSVGNAAKALVRTVNVTDQTAPVVTAPKPLLLTTLDTYAIAATDSYVTTFLAQVSATDNIDTVVSISNDAPVTFPVGVTTVTFTSTDKAGNQGTTTSTVTVQGRLFVGLTTRSILLTDITAWEGKAGHKVQRIQHFYDFSAPSYLWINEVPSALNAGYKVVLTMEPRVGVNDGVTHLRDIYAGLMDPYIDASINGIKNNILATWPNADIWMRFGHEMNGDWYPWGSDFNQGTTVRHLGNTAQDYINAYRHVVDRFRAAGLGSNVVKWVFSPNVWYKDNISQFYPGDTYVDMISVSGFNFGTKATAQPTLTWQTFNQIHQYTYNLLRGLYPTKPYFIAGISSAELGGPTGQVGVDKAAWIDDMTLQLSQGYPKLQGVFWFNENKKASGEADWRIDSSTQSLGAIQRMYGKQGLWKP